MPDIQALLSGYKTYLLAAAAILTAFAGYASSTIDLPHLVDAIFAALGAMTMRAAIAKIE